jgi:Zn-finger nucleic acid-binding protein
MQTMEFEGIEVDRCSSCRGIWFDAGETDSLFGEDAAEVLDTGDPDIGRRNNQIARYRCPRCAGGMMRKYDQRHSPVQYEECTSCRGSFLDAGEFTALIKNSKAALLKPRQ